MKQHITLEQLNELSGGGKARLREWHYGISAKERVKEAKEIAMAKTYITDSASSAASFLKKTGITPILSIGQMIEFLNDNAVRSWEIRMHSDLFDVNYPDSPVSPDIEDHKELVDALWEAVKEVLEK